MPWCDSCDVFVAEDKIVKDKSCPDCDDGLDLTDLKEKPPVNAPWHFWFMIIAAAGYLGWRLIQALIWAIQEWL